MNYELEGRTMKFSKNIIDLVNSIQVRQINSNIINQLLRSATSIGANYREANNASSKKDFFNKIYICRKESEETKYWIELLAKVESDQKEKLRQLWQEAHEYTLMFNAISSSKRGLKNGN